ncbi:acyl transferase/acyl hydrolase/lysophospholipase [Trichoderma evansii]
MKKEDYSSTLLEIPYGFHSPQVDPILEEFGKLLDGINFAKPRILVASAFKGAVVREEEICSPSYLEDQARKPVGFVGALKACQAENLIDDNTVWIEIGPKPMLTSLVAATLGINRDKLLYTITNKDDNWKTISASTTSAYLNLVRYDEPFQAMQEVFVEEDFSHGAVALVKVSPINLASPLVLTGLTHLSMLLDSC